MAKSSLIIAATGLGKTVMMAGIAARWPVGRVMVMSHRFELNQQSQRTLEQWCREEVDFEQAGYRADQRSQRCRVVVASVQTLAYKSRGSYRMERFSPDDFGLLMVDEAHRSIAASYRRIIQYFSQNPDLRIVGVTATPDRLDGVGLGHVYESVACDLNIRWAIENGWLVPVHQQFVHLHGVDYSGIKSKINEMGESDLDQRQLARVLEQEHAIHEITTPILDISADKSCIIFTASVPQAIALASVLNRHKPNSAESIDGSISPMHPVRRDIVRRFKTGELQYLVNCGVATEGFDAPRASVIAIARPTKSRALYTQMVGRGTRPEGGLVDGMPTVELRRNAIASSGKPYCRVIDFVGQAGRHSLVCTADILSTEGDPPEILERARKIAEKSFDGNMMAALILAREDARRMAEEKRKVIKGQSKYTLENISSWSPMSSIPPRSVRGFGGTRQPTERMSNALHKLGYTLEEIAGMNFQQARTAMAQIRDRMDRGLSTIKQRRWLARRGVDAARMTIKEASAEIDRLIKGG